ncbi:hypothetical protein HZS_183 [Henneguya salminicola]|nr:hypothetical protein HZS_183 [Henneguya salminicola]
MFATKWFLLWFINSLPFGIVLRILDRFMLEGSIILYVVAYTIIKYHRKYLINSSLDEIAIFFKELERFKYDSELDKNIRKLTELKFYPIPGVEHDFENIDIAAIINEDVESDSDTKSCYQFPIQSDTWSLNFSNKEPDNYDGSFYKISSESTTINHLHSESSLSCNANLFDPTSHKPPTPPITWEKFTESSEEIFIQGIKELDSSKIQLSQSMLCQLIEKAYRVQSSN